jgi:hypothetical protein
VLEKLHVALQKDRILEVLKVDLGDLVVKLIQTLSIPQKPLGQAMSLAISR